MFSRELNRLRDRRPPHGIAIALLRAVMGVLVLIVIKIGPIHAEEDARQQPKAKEDGTVQVQAFDLPLSSFLGPEARSTFLQWTKWNKENQRVCFSRFDEGVRALRKCLDEHYYSLIAKHKSRYNVRIQPQTTSGIYTEIITPAEGVSHENRNRVLINLHGGGFIGGARYGGQIESIPIAALAKIRVISVDYRLAPEYQFPAASEDVTAVYRELLKDYAPENVGIYGCSAGGLLTAQAVAWFQKEGLPLPGAVGLFCAGAGYWGEGDSGHFGAALVGSSRGRLTDNPYFKNTDPKNRLAFPVRSPQMMANFPPSLLITATRDFALSSVVHTHSELIKQGVEAELHVWEGLNHAFLLDPELPQSREAYDVIVRFFSRYLGKNGQSMKNVEIVDLQEYALLNNVFKAINPCCTYKQRHE